VTSPLLDTTWSLDGILFNASDANGVEWWAPDVDGWYSAPGEKLHQQDRTNGRGVYDSTSYVDQRLITINGTINAPDRASRDTALLQLAGMCTAGQLVLLTCVEPARTFTAMVKRAQKPQVASTSSTAADFQLFLVAPDPRKFGIATPLSTGMATSGIGGIAWQGPSPGTAGTQWQGPSPGTTGTQWSQPGNPGVVALDNSLGTAPADVVVTITTSAVLQQPGFVNTLTGERVTYGLSLNAGDTLVVNCATGSTQLNGNNVRPNLTSAAFFEVPPKTIVPLRFEAGQPEPSATLSISFAPAYY
jgi:hypothetical protein